MEVKKKREDIFKFTRTNKTNEFSKSAVKMLYILPPPTNPSPPSVWDLIINFHRKGCEESETATAVGDSSSKSIKFSCKGQHHDIGHGRKNRRSWCKTTPSSSSPSSHNLNVRKREKKM